MKIIIETIPHAEQRYPTCGDYRRDENGDLHIWVSSMADPRHAVLLALHEFVEAVLCEQRGITISKIDEFDISHPELSEPGADPRAPYHHEHQFATSIERAMAVQLDVDWGAYETAIEILD